MRHGVNISYVCVFIFFLFLLSFDSFSLVIYIQNVGLYSLGIGYINVCCANIYV